MTNDEINQAVATKVMGLSVDPERPNCLTTNHKFGALEGLRIREVVPEFCTDISKAFGVVEKLREKFEVEMRGEPNHEWDCLVYECGNGKPIAREAGDTLPKAICLAALKAVVSPAR